jgi:hypothetical protein
MDDDLLYFNTFGIKIYIVPFCKEFTSWKNIYCCFSDSFNYKLKCVNVHDLEIECDDIDFDSSDYVMSICGISQDNRILSNVKL